MGNKRVAHDFLDRTDALPIDRAVEVIPRIEVEQVGDGPLRTRSGDSAISENPLLIVKESRMQSATDEPPSSYEKRARYIRDERDSINRLRDVPLVAENGLGSENAEPMQTRASKDRRIDVLGRKNAIQTSPYPMNDFRLHETMERHTQGVVVLNVEQQRDVVCMKKQLPRGYELRETLCRYVLL